MSTNSNTYWYKHNICAYDRLDIQSYLNNINSARFVPTQPNTYINPAFAASLADIMINDDTANILEQMHMSSRYFPDISITHAYYDKLFDGRKIERFIQTVIPLKQLIEKGGREYIDNLTNKYRQQHSNIFLLGYTSFDENTLDNK